jgi:hypothetical protein
MPFLFGFIPTLRITWFELRHNILLWEEAIISTIDTNGNIHTHPESSEDEQEADNFVLNALLDGLLFFDPIDLSNEEKDISQAAY